jgi:hypothetical protein
MAAKDFKGIRESVIADFQKQFPEERLYGKIFSLYLLDRYSRLLFRLYTKVERGK